MKRNFRRITIIGMLVIGFSLASYAVTEYCITVTIQCESGITAQSTACGTSTAEIIAEATQLAEAICNL